jgi:hypothetical protein
LKIEPDTHPADEIGRALSQARGIISSLMNCFNRPHAEFSVGTPFIAEAMQAVEVILDRAGNNLSALYENYDLNALHEEDEIEEAEVVNVPEAPREEASYEASNIGRFGRHATVSRLAGSLESITQVLPAAPLTTSHLSEQPAQTYDELLEKLTAMTESAAFHGQGGEDTLLPVLESLREDVLRMRAVA